MTTFPQCQSILIVEDDQDIRETLEQLLKEEGFPAFTAKNGKEGLEMLKHIPAPSLIILDLMMPVMSGWDFLEAQKASAVYATLPVVIVSALKPSTVFGDREVPNAPAGFLKKPIGLNSLLEIVQQYCVPKQDS